MDIKELEKIKNKAKRNKFKLAKPSYKLYLGTKFTVYWNIQENTLEFEPRDPICEEHGLMISIPIKKVIKHLPVQWDKSKESFEDVAKKKPEKVIVYEENVNID